MNDPLVPATAGIHTFETRWIPAVAGMNGESLFNAGGLNPTIRQETRRKPT